MPAPSDFSRRSFVYRKLAALGAEFGELAGGAVALDFGEPRREADAARRLGLCDLSVLPHSGFKGAGTVDWLAGQGLSVPPESNQATRQENGVLALRLAPSELVLLAGLDGDGAPLADLESAWRDAGLPPASPRGFPTPRQHTHAWFLVSGAQAAAMFAKICGVDLRPGKFASGRIAQTSVARLNTVIVRDDQGETLAYHVLVDSASAEYLWGCLLDAMTEFDGAPVGLTAVRGLGTS